MTFKIDILCQDGSPIGVTSKTIWGEEKRIGVGGSELFLLTLCEEWTKRGYIVRLYNNPNEPDASPFEQLTIDTFNPSDNRDVLITFRSPAIKSIIAKGKRVWLSCDQFTIGDFKTFSKSVDQIVCISPFHVNYFKTTYGIDRAICLDIPVRLDDFAKLLEKKVHHRFIFTSVPDRGLQNLVRMWPIIHREFPDTTLMITSDYRLWGSQAQNEHHRVKWLRQPGVRFLGALPREEMLKELLQAEIFLYPSIYDELFCIAVSEAQVAGVFPITSATGALTTTNMGSIIAVDASNPNNDKLFLQETLNFLDDPARLKRRTKAIQKKAIERFDPKRILDEWDEKVFK